MKKLFLLLLAVMISVGLGCNGSSGGGVSSKNLEGYWEGILPDGDFDGHGDIMPYYYIFLDITSQQNGAISGRLHRQVGASRSDAPLSGTTDDSGFQLSADIDGETLTFSGSFTSMAYEYSEEHFIADWSTSRGQSGTVVFVAVNSHILLDSPDTAAWLTNSGKSSYFISEFASLGKYGGSGHPVIFVHGLLSSPSAWDDMIRKFEEDGHFSKYEIWRFGYDTRQPFETIGPEFYALAGEAGLLDRAPFLVAHSMGGIVSRSYIALGGKFTRLVTLGTPHCGTPTGAGGVFTGPGTLEMSPCTPELQALYAQEVVFNDFPNFAVVSGKLTGGWQWVTVSKCSTVCVLSHCSTACVDVPVYLWQFDRDYNTALKAGWLFVNALSFGDNDGAVPTSSANFCSRGIDNFPCDICPPIDFASNKHLTNYDHFMLLDPSTAPDVYRFMVNHLKAP